MPERNSDFLRMARKDARGMAEKTVSSDVSPRIGLGMALITATTK
jgi:hypothetical protein